MKFKTNGVEIAYDTDGPRSGVPVVFIHGFPFNRSMWDEQVKALKADYYTLRYDVRGHGDSGAGDGQYTVELFVDDLIALLDHLKLQSVVAAGLSMGGYIALRAAERHPERFRALVLADTRSEADGNEGKVKRAGQAQAVKDIKSGGVKQFAENFVQAVLHEKTFSEKSGIVNYVRSAIASTPPEAIAGTLIALAARTDTSAFLFQLTIPTLILVGRSDALTPPSASQAMKEKIKGSEMHIIPDAGHLSNMENPEEFTQHLFNFLHKLRRTP